MHLPFYSGPFPATHMHVEHSDWLDSVEVTSSGRFSLFKCKKLTVGIILPESLLQDGEYLNLPSPPG